MLLLLCAVNQDEQPMRRPCLGLLLLFSFVAAATIPLRLHRKADGVPYGGHKASSESDSWWSLRLN